MEKSFTKTDDTFKEKNMLKDLSVEQFINEVDSKSPAPGGGSVSALSSSLGIALAKMVGHLTIGKKKFKALDEDVQDRFNNALHILNGIKDQMIELIDKDTEAFNLIMAAFSLPKETEEEKTHRLEQIELGTLEAIKVPYRIAELSYTAMQQLEMVLKYGNKNALSDLGVSTLLLQAGLEGAILNVKINLPGISDEEVKHFYTEESKRLLQESIKIKKVIVDIVHSKL